MSFGDKCVNIFSIFNFNKSKTSEDDTQKNIPLNTTSSSQQVSELNASNELNYDLKHSDTRANIVKDLGDLSTGPAQPFLPVSYFSI